MFDDKRSPACTGFDQASLPEILYRVAHHVAAHAAAPGQFALGRKSVAHAKDPFADQVLQLLGNLLEQGRGLNHAIGNQQRALPGS